MVVTWSDLAKHCPWSKGQPIGNGIYCAPWHSASSLIYDYNMTSVYIGDQVVLGKSSIIYYH